MEQTERQNDTRQQAEAEQPTKIKRQWAARLRRHPRLVYGNPDEFFRDLLEEQLETS